MCLEVLFQKLVSYTNLCTLWMEENELRLVYSFALVYLSLVLCLVHCVSWCGVDVGEGQWRPQVRVIDPHHSPRLQGCLVLQVEVRTLVNNLAHSLWNLLLSVSFLRDAPVSKAVAMMCILPRTRVRGRSQFYNIVFRGALPAYFWLLDSCMELQEQRSWGNSTPTLEIQLFRGMQPKATCTLLMTCSELSSSMQKTALVFGKLACNAEKTVPFQRAEFGTSQFNTPIISCLL